MAWVVSITLVGSIVGVFISNPAVAACDPGQSADIALSLSVSQKENGNSLYSLVVKNFGPSCAQGVRIHVELPPASVFVSFQSSDSWTCPSAPGSKTVDCTLHKDLNPQGSSSLAVEATPPATTPKGAAHITASANRSSDPDPSDNQGWIVRGTDASTGPPTPSEQETWISRPEPESISLNQVLPTSKLATGVPAPCEPRCLAGLEVIFATPPTDPVSFPSVHLTLVLNLPTKQPLKILPIYRFDHERHVWLGPLPACSGGGPVVPDVGCVKSYVMGKGFLTVTIWTAHNGHIRG